MPLTFAAPWIYYKDEISQFSISKRYSHVVNLLELRYFVSIAEEGSFTRAAERLLVAEPSLSQYMKSLEHELGGALLERIPKGVRLTAAGKEFCPRRALPSNMPIAQSALRAACSDSKVENSKLPP